MLIHAIEIHSFFIHLFNLFGSYSIKYKINWISTNASRIFFSLFSLLLFRFRPITWAIHCIFMKFIQLQIKNEIVLCFRSKVRSCKLCELHDFYHGIKKNNVIGMKRCGDFIVWRADWCCALLVELIDVDASLASHFVEPHGQTALRMPHFQCPEHRWSFLDSAWYSVQSESGKRDRN